MMIFWEETGDKANLHVWDNSLGQINHNLSSHC